MLSIPIAIPIAIGFAVVADVAMTVITAADVVVVDIQTINHVCKCSCVMFMFVNVCVCVCVCV